LAGWAHSIASRGLDILIYPEVGMDVMTVRLASMRLAPIQVAAWGHPETTGLPTIDYYFSAEAFESPASQGCYVEKLIPLANLGCHYLPEDVAQEDLNLADLGIADGSSVFVCPGTPFKYAPDHDRVFVEIARRLEHAQFVFFSFGPVPLLSERLKARLSRSFETAGLDASRHLVFVPWQTKGGFYALMRQADVFLDTIGFSGFNTAMQAVECGLPIVTREGRFMRGRFASAILRRMDLAEIVADSDGKYVEDAVKLASDPKFNAAIRERIRSSRHVLFGDPQPIAAMENFLAGLVPGRP
jgi:predicted O-linked N-acetylglucosamine transferase (SPINDLY family)